MDQDLGTAQAISNDNDLDNLLPTLNTRELHEVMVLKNSVYHASLQKMAKAVSYAQATTKVDPRYLYAGALLALFEVVTVLLAFINTLDEEQAASRIIKKYIKEKVAEW